MLVPIVISALGTVSKRFHCVYIRKAGLDEVSTIAKSLFTGNSENYKMNLKVTGVQLVPGNGWTTKKPLRTDNNI